MRTLALLLAAAWALAAADLPERIRETIGASPVARTAFWGVRIVEVESGSTLCDLNSSHFFVPASNTKLFTTALGLARLGPDHRFRTTVLGGAAPDARGAVPWLRLVGGGDPNLSARAIPYRPGPVAGDPLQAIEDLADQIAAKGVRRVDGDITGDDTAYVWEPFPDGWSVDDPVWEYGAPVSALTLNDNAFSLTIRPGAREGGLAALELAPPVPFYLIDNRVVTAGSRRRIRIDREPGGRQLRLWGVIPRNDRGETTLLGIDDPALYAARALADALARRGVAVKGRPVAAHLYPDEDPGPPPAGVELARRESAPLIEDLRITGKVSQNLHAELILRAVARERSGIGSRQAGLEEMEVFLDEAGVPRDSYSLRDGSGLSRLNLVSPAAVTGLLRFMHGSASRDHWLSLLPIAGRDGTLEHRLRGAEAGRIRAKTGTLSHVSALSGYADTRSGRLAFSILVNNYNGSASEIRAVIDKICSLMLE
ncbi:MAG: D-alanyl-D-alanine carboxypeptidase/D-alanyl-D-alanine-endopeptidase [Bryobacteraceae bacterium]